MGKIQGWGKERRGSLRKLCATEKYASNLSSAALHPQALVLISETWAGVQVTSSKSAEIPEDEKKGAMVTSAAKVLNN